MICFQESKRVIASAVCRVTLLTIVMIVIMKTCHLESNSLHWTNLSTLSHILIYFLALNTAVLFQAERFEQFISLAISLFLLHYSLSLCILSHSLCSLPLYTLSLSILSFFILSFLLSLTLFTHTLTSYTLSPYTLSLSMPSIISRSPILSFSILSSLPMATLSSTEAIIRSSERW